MQESSQDSSATGYGGLLCALGAVDIFLIDDTTACSWMGPREVGAGCHWLGSLQLLQALVQVVCVCVCHVCVRVHKLCGRFYVAIIYLQT